LKISIGDGRPSVSTNRDLTDFAVGAGYAAEFGGGNWSAGAG
jgi:hypothetical protein